MTKKIVNGKILDLTSDEENELQNRKDTFAISDYDFAINDLREKRNILLSATDFYALQDVNMTQDMTNYRQALRDLPDGLSTVEDVKAKEFPTKP